MTVICFLIFLNHTVYAAGNEKEKSITPGNLKEWNDGAKVTKKATGKAMDYNVSVTADTTGLTEDYYSVYLYDYTKRNIESYDGIQFHYRNENDSELKINVTFTVNNKTSVSMSDHSFAILKENGEDDTTEVLATSYGTLTIPSHFDGIVYVPFSQLVNENGETIALKSIQSWGITTVIEKEEQAVYSIGDIAFLENSIAARKASNFLITLSGEEQATIPSTGAIIETYKAKVFDLEGKEVDTNVRFFMKEEMEGVSITEDGTLEIQNNCVATQVELYAKTIESINAGKITVSLERVSPEVAAVGVPSENEVNKINSVAYIKLNDSVILIRIMAIVITAFFVIVFLKWFKVAKENYKLIRKKLYQEFQDNRGEEEL